MRMTAALIIVVIVTGCARCGAKDDLGSGEAATAAESSDAAATSQTSGAEEQAERIADDLVARPLDDAPAWIIEHERPISANALVYVADDGTPILADTPWTPAATRTLLDWIEGRFGELPALATISHFHLDAAGGLSALHEEGVETVASEHTARLLVERGEAMRQDLARTHGAAFEGWEVAEPQQTFAPDEPARLSIGGSSVEIHFPGPAHTADNVVTWFPGEGLLFGGCLVKGGDSLGFLGHADLARYPDSVRKLQALEPALVVSGHGARHDAEQLENTLRLAEAEAEAAEADKAVADGGATEDAAGEPDLASAARGEPEPCGVARRGPRGAPAAAPERMQAPAFKVSAGADTLVTCDEAVSIVEEFISYVRESATVRGWACDWAEDGADPIARCTSPGGEILIRRKSS